jgi:hypothetical protein
VADQFAHVVPLFLRLNLLVLLVAIVRGDDLVWRRAGRVIRQG